MVNLNSLVQVVQLQNFGLDLKTIKVLIVSLERNWKKESFKKLKKVSYNKNCFMNIIVQMGMRVLQTGASPW